MKKILLLILSLIIAVSLVIPIATPVTANTEMMFYLGMNINSAPFNNVGVRLAIYLSLDRYTIADTQSGTMVVSIVQPSVPNPAVNRPYIPGIAKNWLFAAGYPAGFSTTLYTTPNLVSLAIIISEYIEAIPLDYPPGMEVTVETLPPAEFFSRLQNHELPFFLTSTPVDNTIMPAEALGRLLMSDGPQNFTGYNNATFDSLFSSGQNFDAENCAFIAGSPPLPPLPDGLPIVPLFYLNTDFYTVRVIATRNDGPPASVPIGWSKTGGMGPMSGSLVTPFNIFHAGGDVTLTAPITHNQGIKFYLFKDWLVGTPPEDPDDTPDSTVTFAADADKLATAEYEHITNLGPIYPMPPDVNPVGISHTVWVELSIPHEGVKVAFKIEGANSGASDYAYTDATGKATFTYNGDNAGIDGIWAYIDVDNDGNWLHDDQNGNGVLDPGEPCEPRTTNTTTKSWVENFITGAGIIKNENKEVEWAFNFQPKLGVSPEGGVVGQFQIIKYDGTDLVSYNMSQFEMLGFSGEETSSPSASNNTVRFRGTGTGSDGSNVLLLVVIEDADVGKDKIAVVELVSTPPPPTPPDTNPWIGNIPIGPSQQDPLELVPIDGGNFQIHDMK